MASLNPYTSILGLRKAKHLLRRSSFNYSKSELDAFALLTAQQAVARLIIPTENTLAEPYDPQPTSNPDGFWTSSTEHPNTFDGQGRKRAYTIAWWWYNSLNEVSLKHKLTFFLHTCFTAAKDSGSGFSTNYYDHLRLLELFSYGNLQTLAKKITLDNSILNYLDNTNNNANNPNENYAREFLELFTILKGPQVGDGDYTNYTEIDVQQAAKVFSGFKRDFSRQIIDIETGLPSGYPNKNRHDQNDKTFSHAFDNQIIEGKDNANGMMTELDDFVAMVFAKEETARSFCRRLYRYFIKSEWDEDVENDIIIPLATQLKDNNYELLPIVETLLASEHFYDVDDGDDTNEIIGAIVKSPFQLISEVCSMFDVNFPDPTNEALYFYRNFFRYFVHNSFLGGAGMSIFNPDSVAGYPASYQEPDFDRHWFSSNSLISRYKMIESLIYSTNTISGGRIYTFLDTVDFVEKNIINAADARTLVTEISELLYPESIDESRITYFVNILLDGYSEDYWTTDWIGHFSSGDNTTVKSRLDTLIIAMINAAEFQLM